MEEGREEEEGSEEEGLNMSSPLDLTGRKANFRLTCCKYSNNLSFHMGSKHEGTSWIKRREDEEERRGKGKEKGKRDEGG